MGAPFGFQINITPDPKQQAAIRLMVELRRADLSYRAIAEAIRAEGVPVSHVTVKKYLDRLSVD